MDQLDVAPGHLRQPFEIVTVDGHDLVPVDSEQHDASIDDVSEPRGAKEPASSEKNTGSTSTCRSVSGFSAIGTGRVDHWLPSSSKCDREHEVVPRVDQQCAIHESLDIDGTPLPKDRLVRPESPLPIPQLDLPVVP